MTDTRAVVAATLRILATERGPVSRTPEYLAELAEVIEHPKVELYCPLCRGADCLDGCPLRASRSPSVGCNDVPDSWRVGGLVVTCELPAGHDGEHAATVTWPS